MTDKDYQIKISFVAEALERDETALSGIQININSRIGGQSAEGTDEGDGVGLIVQE